MPYAREFPLLSRVTNNMDPRLLQLMGQNLTAYNIDTRIEYEKWLRFESEYNIWSYQADAACDAFGAIQYKLEGHDEFY